MKRILITILLMSGIYGCGNGADVSKDIPRAEVRGVKVEKALLDEVRSFYKTSGSVKAETVSIVSSKAMGMVTSVRVKNGDAVKKGQPLITIDDADISKKVNAAEAAYEEALNGLDMAEETRELTQSTYERFKKLHEEKALTAQEMDEMRAKKNIADSRLRQAKAAVERAKAALQEARVYREYTRIKSPVDGVVSDKKIDVGTMAAPGMPLIIIEDPSSYAVHVNVDERIFSRIKKRMNVNVRVGALNLETKGTVSEIAQAIDPSSRTFLVKIAVRGKGLRSGFYANVSIPQGRTRHVMIPSGAVVKRGQIRGVYVVGENKVVNLRIIKTGQAMNGMVEVLSGLDGSESVISGNADNVVDGGVVVNGLNWGV